ncbi:MAG: hypothetical protein Udaeo2_03340 [Candidatus Udaeobacter sp.]|nr:MAG: hypothetical protein Udaeo2_03340 [Candidatus Udaeobacter sp.]
MMNLIYGEVVALNERDSMKMARIKIAGAIKEVSIGLLTGVELVIGFCYATAWPSREWTTDL